MQGLELARLYYAECRPQLTKKIPDLMEKVAIGLAGEGSECFGLDDEISRDHDYGPAFCIWLPDDVLKQNRQILEEAISAVPAEFMGFKSRWRQGASYRVGPKGIGAFYQFFTGLESTPKDWREWLAIPEEKLACAVNGEVFEDNLGKFSEWRQALLDFYPEDVRLKKIAARVMTMAQAGQYNLPRTIKRNDMAAAMLSFAHFSEAALSFVFLLNKQYKPYYKLAARKASQLPVLGEELWRLLNGFGLKVPNNDLIIKVEQFCERTAAELCKLGLSEIQDSWLWLHGPAIAGRIGCEELKCRDLLHD